jgi:hypothetical protein
MIPLVAATGIVGRLILDGTLDQERRGQGAGAPSRTLHHRADSACRTIACRVPWRGEDHL